MIFHNNQDWCLTIYNYRQRLRKYMQRATSQKIYHEVKRQTTTNKVEISYISYKHKVLIINWATYKKCVH